MNPNGNPPFNPEVNQANNQGNNPAGFNPQNMPGNNPGFNPGNMPQNIDPQTMAQFMNMFQTGQFSNMPQNMPNNQNNQKEMSPDQTVFLNPNQGINLNNQQGQGSANAQGNQLNNQQAGLGVPLNNQQNIFGPQVEAAAMNMNMNVNVPPGMINNNNPNPNMDMNYMYQYWMWMNKVFPGPVPGPVPQPNPPSNPTENWTIYFEKKGGQKVMLQFASDKLIKDACTAYRTKSGETGGLKFTFGGKMLDANLTLAQANITNGSTIVVEKGTSIPEFKPTQPVKEMSAPANFANVIFEQKNGGSANISIQISLDKTVAELIQAYKNKMPFDGESKFIFNGQNLNPALSLKSSGIKNMSKILVITTKEIEGA